MEHSDSPGKLYLIPSLMGEVEPLEVLPLAVKKVLDLCDHYIVENEKTARAFIKRVFPTKNQSDLVFYVTNKFSDPLDYPSYLEPCLRGEHMGVISEAGAPGIADPGAEIVNIAYSKNIRVVPLVGPSSIFMAMMASGMNGQNFAFVGYLELDSAERKKKIRHLESLSRKTGQSQIFMETPYRNQKLFDDLMSNCQPLTRLCIAREVSLASEFIKSMTIQEWKKNKPDLEKKPSIFIIDAR
ncbi:MAG: SAM-dependent methyltransferase [Bacteroidetes bacterium]|nr:MAG: SAM-dependent methyltransferase [Bacteroidota bacterium]